MLASISLAPERRLVDDQPLKSRFAATQATRSDVMTDPVLIVGAGPTGLTAALELSRMRVPVRLIDKREAPAETSRAIGVQARTLELFEQRGLAEEMVRLGNRGRSASIYGGGKRVFRLDFGHVESRYPFMLLISQAETERVLREAIARQGVTPQWNTELIGVGQDALSQDASPVQGILKLADGSLERVAAPWLISAEGAHSLVRTTLDLAFEGHTREEQYALGDLLVAGDLPDSDIQIFSSDHGFMALFPMGGEHFRLIASNPLNQPSKDAGPSLDELQRIYDQRSHIRSRFHDLTWSSWFRINSRMVSRLKVGRLLLGGDAAHIHSPAGAQGMNTGIQDMINVSWKLAMVMNGQAPPALLDTYEADRLPIMRGVLFKTDKLTTAIGTENPVVRSLFNHLGPFIGGTELVQENAMAGMSQVALNYRNSSLSEEHTHGGALRAGDHVPDINVRMGLGSRWVGTTLLSALDPSHLTLVAAVPDGTTLPPNLKASVPESRFVEIAADAKDAARFETTFGKGGAAVLVRPDGYVGLTSPISSAADQLAAYRRKWFSASAAHAHS
jgi:2-polyprenyl-6-methoxyphenol hydroxylase-like FAD-dependent oxidoreductase